MLQGGEIWEILSLLMNNTTPCHQRQLAMLKKSFLHCHPAATHWQSCGRGWTPASRGESKGPLDSVFDARAAASLCFAEAVGVLFARRSPAMPSNVSHWQLITQISCYKNLVGPRREGKKSEKAVFGGAARAPWRGCKSAKERMKDEWKKDKKESKERVKTQSRTWGNASIYYFPQMTWCEQENNH